ncbi:MAG: GTP-binding protein [Candidatus Micrarchaeota archaeon]|nr:GTP-binding protein [Candidatus Micrarchaeota archaeon]
MDIDAKIRELEEELARTQKNKATEKHIGLLMAKIAKLRREKIKQASKSKKGHGFNVSRTGDGRAALLGFPSVGKSSLISKLTGKESKTAGYAFTTLDVIPGMLHYKGAKIQVLDLPGIITEASKGKGRGKEVLSVVRTSDVVVIVLDAEKAEKEYQALMKEVENAGIRLNKSPPDVSISKKSKGGINIYRRKRGKGPSDDFILSALREHGILNADVVVGENVTEKDFIDALDPSLVYLKGMVVINKIDLISQERLKELQKLFPDAVFVSIYYPETLERLKEKLYDAFEFIRVYTKPWRGEVEKEPLILRKGATVKEACEKIHRDLLKNFRYALVWGPSAKHPGQRVGLEHKLEDGDIITIIAR